MYEDIFSGHRRNRPRDFPVIDGHNDEVVEVHGDEFVGAIVGWERTYDGEFVRLEDRRGNQRLFQNLRGGFLLNGQRVTLRRPRAKVAPKRSNSGSRRVENLTAKVAAPSRIWVEGIHDATIVEQVWGHDLRVEGVVVEYLEGLDNLEEKLREFQPGPGRRVGVLADHLLEGTKEQRLTEQVGEHVLVTGHPYIDIWAAVKPSSVGIPSWPDVPYGQDWKTGVCEQLGWSNPQVGWQKVRSSVKSFRDLDSTLIGAVERLVDFVTNHDLSKHDLM